MKVEETLLRVSEDTRGGDMDEVLWMDLISSVRFHLVDTCVSPLHNEKFQFIIR